MKFELRQWKITDMIRCFAEQCQKIGKACFILQKFSEAAHLYFYLIFASLIVVGENILLRILQPNEHCCRHFIYGKIYLIAVFYYFLLKAILQRIPFRHILLITSLPLLMLTFSFINFWPIPGLTIIAEMIDCSVLSICLLCCVFLFSSVNTILYRVFSAIVQWLCLFPVAVVVWVLLSNMRIDSAAIATILTTNFSEIVAYCSTVWYYPVILLVYFFSIIPIYLFLTGGKTELARLWKILLCCFILASALLTCHNFQAKHFHFLTFFNSKIIQEYEESAKELRDQLCLLQKSPYIPKIKQKPNIAIIIGESHSRAYMTPENSPFYTSIKTMDHCAVPRLVYACYTHTAETLRLVLTNRNQYQKTSHWIGLPALLTNAGYHSFWISNQTKFGIWGEGTVSAIASQCQKEFFTRYSQYSFQTQPPDTCLLKHIPAKMDNPSVIFLHLFGCHWPYRFDESFQNFGKCQYEKCLRTVDFFLQTLTEQLERSGCDIIIYCADHGEVPIPGVAHEARLVQLPMIEIPFWIYFSKKYMETNPELVSRVRSIQDKIITNDLLWNVIGGILEFDGTVFPEDLNPFSAKYRIKTLLDAKTMRGEKCVQELFVKESKQP